MRGFLLHITHYDSTWLKFKSREKPFDLDLGLEIVDAMAEAGLNVLVIDCEDGVKYKSHPELARRYTIPMEQLKKLADYAYQKGMEVVPKLNFFRDLSGITTGSGRKPNPVKMKTFGRLSLMMTLTGKRHLR